MAQRGTYQTKVKSAIIQYLEANRNRTVCASDILNFLHEQEQNTNPTTVYRCLAKLCDEQIVIKYADQQGDKATYQYVGQAHGCENHLHIKCVKCGALAHLDCAFMDEFEEHIKEHHGFSLQCDGSLLYGVCKNCAAKDNKK